MKALLFLLLCLLCIVASYKPKEGKGYSVTYDHRSLLIDGERILIISGSIHYPRSSPAMWPALLQQTKAAGINMVQIYVFWNLHEPIKGQYYFEDNANITYFIELCQEYELYVNLRIGPYVCAEWNYGGFPIWLKDIPDIEFRTYNKPYLSEMADWTTYIVNKLQPYFAPQGGPIVLAQIENEYGNVESYYGEAGKQYVTWCVQFALSLQIGIPWIMCQQNDQPLVINTCNGFYCDGWIPSHFSAFPNQPAFWTEDWPGWFQNWGEAKPTRPVQDILYAMARWFSAGGTHHNYYMWHGGTTFGRFTGGPFIVTSYDYNVALNEYGFPHNPKYSRSVDFHNILITNQGIILNNQPVQSTLNNNVEASVFGKAPNATLTFLSYNGTSGTASVTWNNNNYVLNPWSVIILEGNTQVFDTSYLPVFNDSGYMTPIQQISIYVAKSVPISVSGYYTEKANSGTGSINSTTPLEQLSMTHDTTDYLWSSQQVTIPSGGAKLTFTENYDCDLTYVYVDNALVSGPTRDSYFSVNIPGSFAGNHQLQVLTLTVGLINYGVEFEKYTRGILGSVILGSANITSGLWLQTGGLQGEQLQIYTPQNLNSVSWTSGSALNNPLTWYKAYVNLPSKSFNRGPNITPYALDMTGMTKGMVWVNGKMLGRYWLIVGNSNCNPCNYAGNYDPSRCREGCGQPSQQYYHVPTDWLMPTNNLVVIFEESGGNPAQVQLVELQM